MMIARNQHTRCGPSSSLHLIDDDLRKRPWELHNCSTVRCRARSLGMAVAPSSTIRLKAKTMTIQ
eukprot:2756605-Amphidinium_carterae.2